MMLMMMLMITKNEMKFLCHVCQTDEMANENQGEMIREGVGHALAVPDPGNGTA